MTAPAGAATRREPAETRLIDGTGVASAEQVDDWLADALPGDTCIYAHESFLQAGHSGAGRIRAMHEAGLVQLLPQRRVGRCFDYRARRCKDPAPRSFPVRSSHPGAAATEQQLVRAVLTAAAREGRPCPTNVEIARRCKLHNADRARYRIRQLIELGVIRVDLVRVEPRRVVTIVRSGAQTGVIR